MKDATYEFPIGGVIFVEEFVGSLVWNKIDFRCSFSPPSGANLGGWTVLIDSNLDRARDLHEEATA